MDGEKWQEFLLASENEMKENLWIEIEKMKRVVSVLEQQKNDLLVQLSKELGGVNIELLPVC